MPAEALAFRAKARPETGEVINRRIDTLLGTARRQAYKANQEIHRIKSRVHRH